MKVKFTQHFRAYHKQFKQSIYNMGDEVNLNKSLAENLINIGYCNEVTPIKKSRVSKKKLSSLKTIINNIEVNTKSINPEEIENK